MINTSRQFSKRRPMSEVDNTNEMKEMRQCLVGTRQIKDCNFSIAEVGKDKIREEDSTREGRKEKDIRDDIEGSELASPSSSSSSSLSSPNGSYELVRAGDSLDSPDTGSLGTHNFDQSDRVEAPENILKASLRRRVIEDTGSASSYGSSSGNSDKKIKRNHINSNHERKSSSKDSISDIDGYEAIKSNIKLSKLPVEVGDDFSSTSNIILFCITSIPLAVTVYMGYIGSKAFGPWIVITFFHFWYVGLTYRGAPEITGCREIQEVRRDGPVIRHIGETVRRYFNGSIIKECDLDPKGIYYLR